LSEVNFPQIQNQNKPMAQKLINKQTISFLNQIQTVVSQELNQKSALYYRHKIIERLISDNNDKSDDFIQKLFRNDSNQCPKCLSHIKRWRIRPKPKFNQKRRKFKSNKLIGKCDLCLNTIRIDGVHKQRQPNNKSNQKRLNHINLKKNSSNVKNSQIMKTSIKMSSDKRINVLQNLLSSNKKKKRDQKTGLFDFLQTCSQNH